MRPQLKNWLVLAVGLALLLVSNGNWVVPAAAWLSPLFILRFLRTQEKWWGVLIGGTAYIGVFVLAWRGMILAPGLLYYLVAGGIGLVLFVPFVVDILIATRLTGFLATLVFPSAYTAVEYVCFQFTPFGTWGSLAYTQCGNLPLMQLASVTGIYGVTFLVTWLAPVVNWIWEQKCEWPVVRRGVMAYAGVMVAVWMLGGAYLVFAAPESSEVKVAGVQSQLGKELLEPELAWFFEGDVSRADWNAIFTKTKLVIDDQFQKTTGAARGGARIVSWAEASVMVPKADESAFLDRGRRLAQQEQIYLVMAYAANLHTDPARVPQDKMYENKVVIVGPAGDVLSTYRKTILVPGVEAALSVAANDDATVVATPYGRLSSLICYDNDFPSFVRAQVGKAGADILIDPSGDWEDIDPYHTNMMAFRAIENGFSVVRITSAGLSAAYDYQGRTLATMDYFKTDDKVFTAYVPQRGVTTLYSRVGDLFAWMTLAGLISLIGQGILRGRRPAAALLAKTPS